MPIDPRPRRRSLRLPGYDYSQAGAYFITACIHNRAMLFGAVIDGDVRLSEMGTIVQQTWDELPTHYHGIDLDAFIRAYIANNPARWADDPENISRAVPAETGRV
jgi:putative transposase